MSSGVSGRSEVCNFGWSSTMSPQAYNQLNAQSMEFYLLAQHQQQQQNQQQSPNIYNETQLGHMQFMHQQHQQFQQDQQQQQQQEQQKPKKQPKQPKQQTAAKKRLTKKQKAELLEQQLLQKQQFEHFQQLQQAQILSEQNALLNSQSPQEHYFQPLATPTDWHRPMIKDDYFSDDKNNDSGISPGHYISSSPSTSSASSSATSSRRSSTVTAINCSFTPESSPAHLPADRPEELAPRDGQMNAYPPMDFSYSPNSTNNNNNNNNNDNINNNNNEIQKKNFSDNYDDYMTNLRLTCPICPFAASNKLIFTQHLASHCSQIDLEPAEFLEQTLAQLQRKENNKSPVSTTTTSPDMEHDGTTSPLDQVSTTELHMEKKDVFEPGIRVPKLTSQGKVKTHRCKICKIDFLIKLDLWAHNRIHMRKNKMLTCPACPFVTEFKHHLEYHLRNHTGSKPYKCKKCSYACVNKSMLNSHLKSHSKVYQFRCADCTYATKYCHSLKMHLRKYHHKPAMVLNPDGTPNPIPIIDVYGKKRGPKLVKRTKRTKTTCLSPEENGVEIQEVEDAQPSQPTAEPSVMLPPPESNPMEPFDNMGAMDFSTPNIIPILLPQLFNTVFGAQIAAGGPITTQQMATFTHYINQLVAIAVRNNFIQLLRHIQNNQQESIQFNPMANSDQISNEAQDLTGPLNLTKGPE